MVEKIEKKEIKLIEEKKKSKIEFDFENYIYLPIISARIPRKKDFKK